MAGDQENRNQYYNPRRGLDLSSTRGSDARLAVVLIWIVLSMVDLTIFEMGSNNPDASSGQVMQIVKPQRGAALGPVRYISATAYWTGAGITAIGICATIVILFVGMRGSRPKRSDQ